MELTCFGIPVAHGQSHTVYECYVPCKCVGFRMRLLVANGEVMTNALLKCDWELHRLLNPHSVVIQQILGQSSDVKDFLQDFSSFLTTVLREEPSLDSPHPWDTTSIVPHILSQMETLGWDKLDSIDSSFQQVNLKLCDARGKPHILHVNLSAQANKSNAMCTVDLPIRSTFHIKPEKQVSLENLLEQFRDMLRRCQDFWDMMFEIDHNTWVLEPEKPGPSACHRRIAIDTNASLQIKVDAYLPRMLPECRFLGADQRVAPLKEKLNNNVHKWNMSSTLLENLQNVLEVTFPSHADSNKEKFSVECGICYSYQMDNQIPDKVCDDHRCGQSFHHNCLYKWLRALPSSRQSFNMIFGECPFCNKPVTVKMSTSE